MTRMGETKPVREGLSPPGLGDCRRTGSPRQPQAFAIRPTERLSGVCTSGILPTSRNFERLDSSNVRGMQMGMVETPRVSLVMGMSAVGNCPAGCTRFSVDSGTNPKHACSRRLHQVCARRRAGRCSPGIPRPNVVVFSAQLSRSGATAETHTLPVQSRQA